MKTSIFRIAAAVQAVFLFMTFAACTEKENISGEDGAPAVTIQAGTASSSSISFTLTATNADEVVYMVLQSSGVDLGTDELLADGTSLIYAGDPITRTFTGQPETAYMVYAVALSAGTAGEIASLEMTTGAVPPPEYDEEVRIAMARASYYGPSSVSGVDEYIVSFSDAVNGIDGEGTFMAVPNSLNFRLILYVPTEVYPERPVFPAMEYTFNAGDTPAVGTIDNASACVAYDAAGERDMYGSGFLSEGTSLTVTKEGETYTIEGSVCRSVLGTETLFHVTYSGPLPVNVADDDDDDMILDSDLLDISFTEGSADFVGDDGTDVTVSLDFSTDADGAFSGSGEVLHLEVLSSDIQEEQDGSHVLSEGTYTVGASGGNRIGAGDFNGSDIPEGSYVATFRGGEINAADGITGGTMKVTGTGYQFDFETQRGHRVTGSYTGALVISSWPEDSFESTLTEDFEIDFGSIPYAASMTNQGDWFDCGHDNWDILIEAANDDETVRDYFYLTLITQGTGTASVPAGRYSVCNNVDSPQAMSFMPGMSFSVDYGWASGEYSYWYREAGGSVTGAPFTGGYVDVAVEEGVYTLDLHFTDDAGNNITGTWSGEMAIF